MSNKHTDTAKCCLRGGRELEADEIEEDKTEEEMAIKEEVVREQEGMMVVEEA